MWGDIELESTELYTVSAYMLGRLAWNVLKTSMISEWLRDVYLFIQYVNSAFKIKLWTMQLIVESETTQYCMDNLQRKAPFMYIMCVDVYIPAPPDSFHLCCLWLFQLLFWKFLKGMERLPLKIILIWVGVLL